MCNTSELEAQLERLQAVELLLAEDSPLLAQLSLTPALRNRAPWHFEASAARRQLLDHFKTRDLSAFGIEESATLQSAAGALLQYVRETQQTQLPHLDSFRLEQPDSQLHLDAVTRRNLELLSHPHGEQGHTLVAVMDSTVTPTGGRLLRRWIADPSKPCVSCSGAWVMSNASCPGSPWAALGLATCRRYVMPWD